MDGLLLVNKPSGWTSHDVVARLRHILNTREIGHAGTLDPLATGLLILGVGQGTKLLTHLQNDDKRYSVCVLLGTETDTLDSEGKIVGTAPLPKELTLQSLQIAASQFVGVHMQEVPAFSAVKVQGTSLHKRARRGEQVQSPSRSVELYSVQALKLEGPRIWMNMHCAKGFYVRSFARDLARSLDTVGHVESLRRTHAGPFLLDEALDSDVLELADHLALQQCKSALLHLREGCRGLRRIVLNTRGQEHVRHGRRVPLDCIVTDSGPPETLERVACLSEEGELLAIAKATPEGLIMKRVLARDRAQSRECAAQL